MTNIHQVRWSCRRGMAELDLLLERFVDTVYRTASLQEQEAFKRLLLEEDSQLQDYFWQRKSSHDAEVQAVIEKILNWNP